MNENENKNKSSKFSFSQAPHRLFTSKMGDVEKIIPKDICRIYETCGSCALLNKDYKSQILLKTSRLKEFATNFPGLSVQNFCESEEKLAYRQSVKLVVSEHFVNGKPWIDIGFYRQIVNKIVDIGNCPIQNSHLNDVMFYLRNALKHFKISIYSPRLKKGILSGLILRSSRSTKQTFVTFLVKEGKPAMFRELACHLIEKLSFVQGVFLQQEQNDLSSPPVLVAGSTVMEEKFGLLTAKISYDVELPVHPVMTSKVYSRVLELCELSGRESVFHLFSGIGILSCLLAQKAKHVIALDEKKSYAKNTELNIKNLNIKNIQIEEGKIQSTLSHLKKLNSACDVAVVTAPRAGVKENLIELLAEFSPKRVLFVASFNEFLHDNLKSFEKAGYKPVFLEPFDSHPATPYFEVLTYLQKN